MREINKCDRPAARAGEPEYVLSHITAWTGYAAMLCGRWDDAIAMGERRAPLPRGRRRGLRPAERADRHDAVELDERIGENALSHLEALAAHRPRLFTLRIQLARALNAGVAELRQAIAALDEARHAADVARASALLALRTGDAADRADARRRLEALGDRAHLQRLAEGTVAPAPGVAPSAAT